MYDACSDGEVFRVYVVMPLLPAFEGEVGTSSGAAIQVVMHWNYMSISRGGKSLLERLAAESEYISRVVTKTLVLLLTISVL